MRFEWSRLPGEMSGFLFALRLLRTEFAADGGPGDREFWHPAEAESGGIEFTSVRLKQNNHPWLA